MRKYIDSLMTTLPDGRKISANELLYEASLEKNEIGRLLQSLGQDAGVASTNFIEFGSRSLISGRSFFQNFNDLSTRMSFFYNAVNEATDLLDSASVTMLSEIKSLEKELDYIEKSISNYAFKLADGGSFNFAFIESFSDYINVADDIDFNLPDRDGSYFTDEEQGLIDFQEDVLKIRPSSSLSIGIMADVAEANFAFENATMSNIENLMTTQKDSSWKVTAHSLIPIAGSIDSVIGMHGINSYAGAQLELHIDPIQPSPCDSITLSPISGSSIDVIQIRLFLNEDYSQSIDLFDSVEKLGSQSTFYFDTNIIYKAIIYLRQSTYTRPSLDPLKTEEYYRNLFNKQRNRIKYSSLKKKNKVRNLVSVSQVFVKNFIREQRGLNKISVRNYNRRLGTGKWGPLDSSTELDKVSINSRNRGDWFGSDELDDFAELLTDYKQFSDELVRKNFPRKNESTRRPNPFYKFLNTKNVNRRENELFVSPSVGRVRSMQKPVASRASLYKYELGLNYVLLGMQSKPSKCVYISKKIPSTGDIGELRLRESSKQAKYVSDPTNDINISTSVEYSVTTVARPALESDWIPILPANEPEVVAERLYIDAAGRALFRFPAVSINGVSVYRNNKLFSLAEYKFVFSIDNSVAIGIDFDITSVTVSDIFTVSYTPVSTASTVNLENLNFNNVPLVSSFDDDGTGEGFTGLNGQLALLLKNEPYINPDQVAAATYSSLSGLSYQPIVVELQDGTNAVNLTNYQGGSQTSLSSDNLGLSFIQNGKYLIFSEDITQPFRVFYQYLPKNLRVRVVLRSNFANSNLTPKVDFYQVKGKIRQTNSRLVT